MMRNINNERKMQNEPDEIRAATEKNEMLKKIAIIGGALLIAFLLGFIPMWLSAQSAKNERDAAIETLRPSVLQNDLATAAINARRGEYEPARKQMSDFYVALRNEFDRDDKESAFDRTQRENLQPILAQRDELITMLARGDAASADRLSEMYFAFVQTKNSPASGSTP